MEAFGRYTRTLAIACFIILLPVLAGVPGGRIVVAQRSELKTLNPVFAIDEPSRAIVALMGAPLVRVNPETLLTEGVLAESWRVSPDGREVLVRLRPGLKFSDGTPLTVADVLFTFEVHLASNIASPQQELLKVGGYPAKVAGVAKDLVKFTVAEPYALGERMLAGIAILPKHRLEGAYREGKLASSWSLTTPPDQIAGAGPFCLKGYTPGQRIVLTRNPHYWKKDQSGKPLPYLDEVEFVFAAGEDAQVARLLAGETDLLFGFSGNAYRTLERASQGTKLRLFDLGPGLDYTFLLFNMNSERALFQQTAFRKAISAAVDRQAIIRLVYGGRGTPLWSHVTPARKHWTDETLPKPTRSLDDAKDLLRRAGFSWDQQGRLLDPKRIPVEFTIIANSSNSAHTQTAAVVSEDLKNIGVSARSVPLEFRSLVDRVVNRREFDTAIMALRPGDLDPVADMNVLLSSARMRLWNTSGKPDRDWEEKIDVLMRKQLGIREESKRKEMYVRVQRILAEQLPFVCLASPNVLVAARPGLENLRPVASGDIALWNVDELFWSSQARR